MKEVERQKAPMRNARLKFPDLFIAPKSRR